jgi:hypothetical protein
LFKKVVIADRLSVIVNSIYDSTGGYNGLSVILGTSFICFSDIL